MLLVAALNAALGLIIVGAVCLSIPKDAASGKISRNAAIGIRTRETKKTEEGWRAGHLAATPILTTTGKASLIIAAVLVVLGFFGEKLSTLTITVGVLGYVVVIGGVLWAKVVANGAAKAANRLA